jgi:hypothetical protein
LGIFAFSCFANQTTYWGELEEIWKILQQGKSKNSAGTVLEDVFCMRRFAKNNIKWRNRMEETRESVGNG